MKTRSHACVTPAPDEQGGHHNDACAVSLFPQCVTRFTGMEHERRRQPALTVCQPRLTPILGMAPSTHRRISRQMAPAPIPGSCAEKFRQIVWARRVAPGPMAAMRPATGGWFPPASGGARGCGPAIGAVHRSRQSWEWHFPPIAELPSKWRRHQFPGLAP